MSRSCRCEHLLVEDDPIIRELVVEALREEGHHVIHAGNAKRRWRGAGGGSRMCWSPTSKLPATVDGCTIAERRREHDPRLPVIYATGFSPVAARPVPGSLSLQKPYHPEEIVQAVS